jgi:hypothetical protein
MQRVGEDRVGYYMKVAFLQIEHCYRIVILYTKWIMYITPNNQSIWTLWLGTQHINIV